MNIYNQNLSLDWIGFSIKETNLVDIEKISSYLFENFNFNL